MPVIASVANIVENGSGAASMIQDGLIRCLDSEIGVYEGGSFKADRFADWLVKRNIPWPHLDLGAVGPRRRQLPADGPTSSGG